MIILAGPSRAHNEEPPSLLDSDPLHFEER